MENKELTDKDNGIEYEEEEEDMIIWGIFNGYLEECVGYYLY